MILRRRRSAYTLVEVLVALVVLLVGIVAIVQLFPVSLQGNKDAELRGAAALLAQQKVDELRRDRDQLDLVLAEIRGLGAPTAPVVWNVDDRLAYSYSGVSTLATSDDPADPTDDPNVARVVVTLNPAFDPSARTVYELRFDR